ncbi:MAG TPA: glycosyltransferase family 4 protein [Alphaproteobacteria bacterium]
MKIAQLCAVDFTLYHFILPLMRALRAAGHEVVAIASDGPFMAKIRAEGFRVEPVTIERSFNLLRHCGSARRLKVLFNRERFDVVHVHTPVAALVGRWAAWRAGVPKIVYTAHGFYFHERMAWPKRAAFAVLEWLGGRLTHVLFTQAEEDAATARRLGLAKGAIAAIGNGVDPAQFHPAAAAAERRRLRAELGAGDGDVVILTVGRLVAEKGYVELIEAMRSVEARLWIVGERLESDHADAVDHAVQAAESDPLLKRRVRFLGYRADVPQLMRAADIYTLPSHREGMPRSVIEAMMSGLPVVGTDIRGTREEVVEGESGTLVPVGDAKALAAALARLVAHPKLRAAWGAKGRERALSLYREDLVIARQLEALGLGGPGAGSPTTEIAPTA